MISNFHVAHLRDCIEQSAAIGVANEPEVAERLGRLPA